MGQAASDGDLALQRGFLPGVGSLGEATKARGPRPHDEAQSKPNDQHQAIDGDLRRVPQRAFTDSQRTVVQKGGDPDDQQGRNEDLAQGLIDLCETETQIRFALEEGGPGQA
ncbi:hypothetical protein [Phenylobacterium sp.]|jgi:hypothetical protein|uniref:hypothetical protein n=1 Tax=Phenylobacterium sp. TaxID=1871053 RepID=UPI0025E6EFE2|nr:hypothetical protein [Phenylobacterium sp.]